MRPSVEIGREFASEMGAKKFAGGDRPNQADISYFGTLLVFYRAGCPKVHEHLQDAGLQEWWARMEAIMPKNAM